MWAVIQIWFMRCLKSATAHVSYMKPFMCRKIWKQHLAGIVTSVPKVLSKQRPAHPPGSSSESTFERLGLRPWQQPPRGVWTYECVVTGLTGGKVLKPGAAVTSSPRSGLSISHNVSLVETCWKSVQGYLSVLFTQQVEMRLLSLSVFKKNVW